MRLGLKFAIAFFISSIVSISFISLLSYTLARNALQKTIVIQQQEQTRQTIDTVDKILDQRFVSVNAISQNDSIISFVQNKAVSLQSDPAILEKLHNTLQTLVPREDMDIIGTTGTVLYSQFSQTIGKQIPPQDTLWFAKAIHGEKVYSDVIHDPESNEETVIFAVPIIDETTPHNVIGVLFGHTSWKEVLTALNIANTNTVELYNKKGLLIGNNQNNKNGFFLSKTSLTPTISFLENTPVNKTITTRDELVSIASEKGSGLYAGNGWFLVTRTPVKIAFAPAVNSAIIIAGLLLPIIIVVNAILLLFILELLRPILLIGQVAEDIAKGNLTKRVPHTGNDEIGWLADSFNRMADTLQELYEGLEKKVLDKTKELSEKMEDAEAMNSFMIKRELKLIELKKQIAELKQQISEKEK
ncbi:MAG: HAMP domain-containing protein [Patescibacteria group bacterium]|nr:HAMP domain-containing protein [Patescibacteria group bacterium]